MKNNSSFVITILLGLLFFLSNSRIIIAQSKAIDYFVVVDASIEDCLKKIKEKTNIGYLTKGEDIYSKKGITLSMHRTSVDSVLNAVLKNTEFTYEINNSVILIMKRQRVEKRAEKPIENNYVVSGKVFSFDNRTPLYFATVFVKNSNRYTNTDENGEFSLIVPSGNITLSVSILGYENLERPFNILRDIDNINFFLREQNLSLNEVIVTAETTQSKSGSSTYKIGEQAIQQIQPVSVKDILQLLPGGKITNPDLTNVSQVSLRNAAPENSNFTNANSFGTSIIVDGVVMSNDANMQADNPTIGASGGKNVANRGLDLRQISASTIESVEVVEGVANARYGNMTSGAVIIKRKAGETPWLIGFNALPSSYQTSISKGIANSKFGSMNFNLDYAFANSSPISKKYYYQRVSGGVRWSTNLNKRLNWRNTISYDISSQFDGTRFEPEEVVHTFRKTRNSNHILGINGGLDLAGRLSYTLSANYGYQYTLLEDYKSDGPLPTIDATEPGTYRGGYTQLAYLTEIEMIGAPLAVRANIEHEQNVKIKERNLSMNYGIDFSYDKNFGSGRSLIGNSVNPSLGYPGNRAANFHEIPASVIYSLYSQNDLNREYENFSYSLRAGLRYDYMIGRYHLLSPRISLSTKFYNNLRLRVAWGLSYKAPAMISLFPGPSYLDIINLSWFTNNPLERLSIITTFVDKYDNSHLKPSRGETIEAGLDYEKSGFIMNFTLYRKDLSKGISSETYLKVVPVEAYKVIERPQDLPPVVEVDSIANFPRLLYRYHNNLNTKTDGFSFSVRFPKINLTNTTFNLTGAYNRTETYDGAPSISSSIFLVDGKMTRWGVYNSISNTYKSFRSNLTIIQHLPVIGLLVTLTIENSLVNKREASGYSIYPYAYYDINGNYFKIPEDQRSSPEYSDLFRLESVYEYHPEPKYSNFHLQIRKETKQGHSFSFYANNFWWHNPTYYDPVALRFIRLNSGLSFGFGATFKL